MEETTLLDRALLGVLAGLGWLACGAAMYAGMAWSSMTVALIAHAALAPVFFGIAAWIYHRRREAQLSPLAVAVVFVSVVIALDLFVVALLVERSLSMFASVAGTWLPFALLFAASWAVGAAVRARVADRAAPGLERLAVDAFLGHRRLAFVGLSTDPGSFSRVIYAELVDQGYDIVPIHPRADEIDGRAAFRRVQDVPDPPEAAIVMTPAAESAGVVRDCVEAGVTHLWFHRGMGPGSASDEALALADEHRLVTVRGRCPLMFLPKTAAGHRAHGYFQKLAGTYPR
jgi:predicted CoA-binding protein